MQFIYKIFLPLSFLINFNSFAQVIQNDFDKDGKSDYTIVSINNDKSLSWSTLLSASNAESSLGTLGTSGDHLILAPWKGSGLPQIGVVSKNSSNNLIWTIKNDQGQEEEREFGKGNITVISGGDFDGDGITDAATAALKRSKVKWQIAFGLFNSLVGQAQTSSVRFGKSGDRVFFASPDGLNDWIGTIGKGVKGRGVLLRLKNLKTGAVQSSTRFPKYIVKRSRPRPFPVNQADKTDLLAFARVSKGNTKIDVRRIDGEQVAQTVLSGKGDVIVGNFTTDAGEEIAIKTSSGFQVYNPNTKQTSNVTTTDGVAVDEININSFSGSSNSGGGGSGGGNNGGGSPPPAGNNACNSVVSWPSSHIYKTIGSSHFTDIRRNTAGLILKIGARGPYPQCVDLVDTKGSVVARMGLYATGNGWAARYYAGIGCGSSTPYSGATIGSRARSNTGSQFIYANFGSVCYGPIDATKCIGSGQC